MAPLDRLPGKGLWAGLKNIPKVTRQREVNGKTSTETAYFIFSLENHTELTPRQSGITATLKTVCTRVWKLGFV
jgi:hypothetical protein